MGKKLTGKALAKFEAERDVWSGREAERDEIAKLVTADGSLMGSVPVVGVTEFRDGKISAWREYFDTGALAAPS